MRKVLFPCGRFMFSGHRNNSSAENSMISLSALTFMGLVLLYSETHVRLTGHNATFAGRVEVFSHKVWGRVLHSVSSSIKWGQLEASVVCRQLGFPGAITALRYSSFGEGSGPVLMSKVQCTGSEKTLQQCQYDNWVNSELLHDNEVGVICKTHDFDPHISDISIRLQGSSVPNTGRVEVLYAGIWGAISSFNWDINAATVVCRQLGYQAGAEAALANVVYGPISGPVWLTNLKCCGSETNLTSCSYDVIGSKSESHLRSRVASVICKDGSSPNGMPVRLRGSNSTNIGRVEVYYAGKWGTISRSGWDINDATVVCRQLGYFTASLSGYGLFRSADVPSWFTNVTCDGNESSLDQCAWDFPTSPSYKSCANVVCKERVADTGFEMRLSGSPVIHAGRVELRFKGVWGTILSDRSWRTDPEVARVICRQLNFTDSILALGWPEFGLGTGPQWFYSNDLHCFGNESNLLNCSHPDPELTRHSYYSDLSVFCKPDVPQTNDFPVRLNGSSVPYAGTIELMNQGVWGGVLGDGHVDINVGHVVCRQLGYSGADKIFNEAVFGHVKGPLWIYRIQCSGHGTKISDCAVITWDKATDPEAHEQRPSYAAGVLCNEGNATASKDLNVRLAGAPIRSTGRVEVLYAGVWGTLSHYEWDIHDAHVVCRQLGYPGAISSGSSNQFGVGTGPTWFTNVRCLDFFPECFQVTCANSGTCIKTAVGAICNCTDGFTGLHCEIPTLSPCRGSPCENGGRCFSNGSSYLCACPKELTGRRCEELILIDKSTAAEDIFNTPFIVLLSVSAAIILFLIAAIVYLIFRNRSRSNNQPSNQGTAFNNRAYNDASVILDEEEALTSPTMLT
ncbi:hypothetical protein ACROYT_G006583 [Oculina patagonica]